MKGFPTSADVTSRLLRTIVWFVAMIAGGCVLIWLFLQLQQWKWLPFVGAFLQNGLVILGIVYLSLWLGVIWSYHDYRFASHLYNALKHFRDGNYKEAVDEATSASERKGGSGLPYIVRSRAYAELGSALLCQRDRDIACNFGLDPDKFVI
ncbi:MAG: hypothetical protein K8F91_16240 [Candidatus Obscuribacterales bacterium]|nr:hypothetical protein [Candidatus Obscuribacterales bacterium]